MKDERDMFIESSVVHAYHQPGFTFLTYSIKLPLVSRVADNGWELVDISKFSRNCLELHVAAVSHVGRVARRLRCRNLQGSHKT